MFQKGEFLKVILEIIILLEFINSMRFGLVKSSVLCLHMFHQISPWPSIVPFSPNRQCIYMKKREQKKNNQFLLKKGRPHDDLFLLAF